MVIIIIILGLISFFLYFTIKMANPFKLYFLFGKKGSGKSTLLVKYMMQYHKKGYCIYTNMRECTLPYVVHIKTSDVGEYVGIPKSCVILDEVGTDFDARKFKQFREEVRDYFIFQRQYKNVVIMASQSWNVDKKIRDLTDKMFLCGKIGPISYARPIRRNITLTEPMGDSESRIADQLVFAPGVTLTWIPKYAKHFSSFSPPKRPFFVGSPSLEEINESAVKRGVARKRFHVGKSPRARLVHVKSRILAQGAKISRARQAARRRLFRKAEKP